MMHQTFMDPLCSARMCLYQEGSPTHPSYPAGHATAAAAGIRIVASYFDLEEWQRDELFKAAYDWGMYRLIAGVHYPSDNLAGMQLGGMLRRDGEQWVRWGI